MGLIHLERLINQLLSLDKGVPSLDFHVPFVCISISVHESWKYITLRYIYFWFCPPVLLHMLSCFNKSVLYMSCRFTSISEQYVLESFISSSSNLPWLHKKPSTSHWFMCIAPNQHNTWRNQFVYHCYLCLYGNWLTRNPAVRSVEAFIPHWGPGRHN